jgi:hypothetical protein
VSSEAPASGPPQLADVDLRGRVEGTATLEITGKVNPLARPVALDLKAKVRELELSPLSPYAIKYAGYGIERGKLSVDLAYVVQPDGQLSASNRIVLNQLAFGEKAEGSTANLPVKLAVALLADKNGVIDIDLPVSGSLSDPQFSLAGIVFKLIGNLIVKASPRRSRCSRRARRRRRRDVDDRVRARHRDALARGSPGPRQDRAGAHRPAVAHPHDQPARAGSRASARPGSASG